MVTATSL